MRYVEPYVVNPRNMNCFPFDEEENYRSVDEAKLGIYVIHEQKFFIPNLIQGEKEQQGPTLAKVLEHQEQVSHQETTLFHKEVEEDIFFLEDMKGDFIHQAK